MRLEIITENRVGMTQDVLAVFTRLGFDVRAVEVTTHHIHVHVPGLAPSRLSTLSQFLRTIRGVEAINPVDTLPGEAREAQLGAVLAALDDPLIAVDGDNAVTLANAAAERALGPQVAPLAGRPLAALLGRDLARELRESGFALAGRAADVAGVPYLVHATPIARAGDGAADPPAHDPAGGVVTLTRPGRAGEIVTALAGPAGDGFEAIIGDSAAIRRARAQAARLGPVDAPLLITGETGTGKELFARACHQVSARAGRPFLALNCAALPEGLAESELFGYAPGAFTSARRGGKPGLLELADTGTVFLDEVGELTPYLQAKLLRFLADGSFRRVGAEAESRVDVRVISATNRDLEAMSRDGAFREDLFFRLNVLALTLPPLRERGEDIPVLADFFLARAARQVGRAAPALTDAARRLLREHAWPGNVRELENVLFRAVTLAETERIDAADLDLGLASGPAVAPEAALTRAGLPDGPRGGSPLPGDPHRYASFQAARDAFEAAFLGALYPDYPSTRKLARRLGLSHAAVADRLKRHGIG